MEMEGLDLMTQGLKKGLRHLEILTKISLSENFQTLKIILSAAPDSQKFKNLVIKKILLKSLATQ